MRAYYKRWGFRGIQKRELSSNVFTCDILNVKQRWYVDIHIIPHMATYASICVKCSVNMKENTIFELTCNYPILCDYFLNQLSKNCKKRLSV